jgi:hypothetical protein
VQYPATLTGADNEAVLRWFVLIVALCLDAAAPGSDPDTNVSVQDGVPGGRRARQARRGISRPPEKPMSEAP